MAKAPNTNSALREDIGENGQNILNAIALLEQATRLDPTFALAYCEIAGAAYMRSVLTRRQLGACMAMLLLRKPCGSNQIFLKLISQRHATCTIGTGITRKCART
jgi:hypothetical protein